MAQTLGASAPGVPPKQIYVANIFLDRHAAPFPVDIRAGCSFAIHEPFALGFRRDSHSDSRRPQLPAGQAVKRWKPAPWIKVLAELRQIRALLERQRVLKVRDDNQQRKRKL